MSASTTDERRRGRNAFVWIAVVAILLFAALSGAWFYLAGKLDAAVSDGLRQAESQGVLVSCDNREVFGYPFRLGIRCGAVGLDEAATGTKATAGGLRTAGQIYDPTRFVAELDGPLVVDTAETPPLDLRWRLAQASAHLWTQGLDRFALVVEAPEIALAEPAADRRPIARSDHIELHLRRNGEALDVAVSDANIQLLEPALAAVPRFDVAADATIDGAAGWLGGEAVGETLGQALAGRNGTIRALRIGLAGSGASAGAAPASAASSAGVPPVLASAEVSGPFQIAPDGTISGDFQIALSDPAGIADLVGALNPRLAGTARTIASAVGIAGRPVDGRTVIDIAVRDGRAALGFIPLGSIPPVR
ncbi:MULTISPECIES: DUF2125 domain-containing protein [unclassified Aureimonas]|uniref:DUF2125 domain-containing protein n=1 Tax=unclassified Aureimonas TaxID=2615206 RepID=UPI0006FF912C|nr:MULTISPECIES: DUF2125 domain-containing protein [unclassified Aureimonas]KQT53971.1 hypothetical protein ASG62_12145 [Aureimonas sp. Leaf427]KQT71589.1 hypothetical protein ASG54_19015 [Aureimonas sp. Leaf460]